jgi:putative addiction module component (TIGR02574 family)
MNERVKQIADQARRLSPDEQAELVDELLAMMHAEPEPVMDKALLEECERRWQAYKRGETRLYTWEEVRARLRKL